MLNYNQFQDFVLSSTGLTGSSPYVSITGEAVKGGSIDFLYTCVFTGRKATFIPANKGRGYKPNYFATHIRIEEAVYYTGKVNSCLIYNKDSKYITYGLTTTRIKRCERYSEMRRLAKYWKKYLEDVKITFYIDIKNPYMRGLSALEIV